MVILNFILATINFCMMVLSLCDGESLWWGYLFTGCCLSMIGICKMIIANKVRDFIDEDELEKAAEEIVDDMIEKIQELKKGKRNDN